MIVVRSSGKAVVAAMLAAVAGGAVSASTAAPVVSTAAWRAAANAAEAGIEWVSLASGTFMMGVQDPASDFKDAQPVHRVTLTKPFKIAKTEVTNKQYKACVAAGVCAPAHYTDGTCWIWSDKQWKKRRVPAEFLGDEQPVVCVDWDQAEKFSEWVGGRLPSEAEWEYAARSQGQDFLYPWGDERATCERAVINDPSFGLGCGRQAAWPVCSKPKGNTKQGVCDMAGNVWEWIADVYHRDYRGAPDDGGVWANIPREPRRLEDRPSRRTPSMRVSSFKAAEQERRFRVDRGGSAFDSGVYVRAAYRDNASPTERRGRLGFRPVLPSP